MQIKELTELLKNQEMRLTEMETEYEVYKTKAQTELIENRDKLETA